MYYHFFILTTAITLLLGACSPNSGEEILSPEPAIPSATVTDVLTTKTPTSMPATQTLAPEEWLSQLEVIDAGNWARLQLLKTFPAEMPLNHSAVAISADGKTMAVGSSEGAQIFFFDLATGQLSQAVPINLPDVGEYFNIVGMQYLPDGTIMANAEGPYAIYHLDTTGNILAMWDGINFAISADKRIMAHRPDAEGIVLVEIATNTPLLLLEDPDAMSFSFSTDGSKIAAEEVGVDYLNTVIWDITNQTRLATLMDTANARFSPDGKFLAVTHYGTDTVFEILSIDGINQLAAIKDNGPDNLNGAPPLWSLDGSILAAQADSSPIAWETTNWQPLNAPALQGKLESFSPDGRILITRTDDGGILHWGVLP